MRALSEVGPTVAFHFPRTAGRGVYAITAGLPTDFAMISAKNGGKRGGKWRALNGALAAASVGVTRAGTGAAALEGHAVATAILDDVAKADALAGRACARLVGAAAQTFADAGLAIVARLARLSVRGPP